MQNRLSLGVVVAVVLIVLALVSLAAWRFVQPAAAPAGTGASIQQQVEQDMARQMRRVPRGGSLPGG